MREGESRLPCVETRFGLAGLINGLKKRMYRYSNLAVPLVVLGPPGTGKTVLSSELMAGVRPWRRVFVSRVKAASFMGGERGRTAFVFIVVEPGHLVAMPTVWLTEDALFERLRGVAASDVPTLFVFDEMRYDRMSDASIEFLSGMVRHLYRRQSMVVFSSQVIPGFLNGDQVSCLRLFGATDPEFRDGFRSGSVHVAVEVGKEAVFLKAADGFVLEAGRLRRDVEGTVLTLEGVAADLPEAVGIDVPVERGQDKVRVLPGASGAEALGFQVMPYSKYEASKLAKDRLKEMRRADSSAKLSHAYEAMAVSLGFANWHAMRARLED